jgi:hypothetical protein
LSESSEQENINDHLGNVYYLPFNQSSARAPWMVEGKQSGDYNVGLSKKGDGQKSTISIRFSLFFLEFVFLFAFSGGDLPSITSLPHGPRRRYSGQTASVQETTRTLCT